MSRLIFADYCFPIERPVIRPYTGTCTLSQVPPLHKSNPHAGLDDRHRRRLEWQMYSYLRTFQETHTRCHWHVTWQQWMNRLFGPQWRRIRGNSKHGLTRCNRCCRRCTCHGNTEAADTSSEFRASNQPTNIQAISHRMSVGRFPRNNKVQRRWPDDTSSANQYLQSPPQLCMHVVPSWLTRTELTEWMKMEKQKHWLGHDIFCRNVTTFFADINVTCPDRYTI